MITLPVTAQMYHQLVQQQMPNNDNTVCVTPMQVQNFISSNSLCGSLANSNLNSSTTYIMTGGNRNVINLPMQATGCQTKTIALSPSNYAPRNRAVMRKTYLKKRVLDMAMVKPKANPEPTTPESKKNVVNNNSSNMRNKNQKLSQQKVEKLQTSQTQPESNEEKNNSLIDDPGESKVKEEEMAVDTE